MMNFVGHRQLTIVNLIHHLFSEQKTITHDKVLMGSFQRPAWDAWPCSILKKGQGGEY